MNNNIQAGISRRIISPPKGIYLIGYGDRNTGNRGIRDDLTATAITFLDDTDQVTIVACDLLAINEETLDRIKQITSEQIAVCCSHTHSGPIVYADKKSSRKNQKYVDFLISQIAEAIHGSIKNLCPVRLLGGREEAEISINRRERRSDHQVIIGRNPDGVVDHSVGIIHIQSSSGAPVANLINFACHNVVLGPKNNKVSADWAGSMRKRIERATGVPALFIQGAAADINPDHEWGPSDEDTVESLGKQVAERVLSGMANLEPITSTPLAFYREKIWLPLESAVNSSNPPKTYRQILSRATHIPEFLVDPLLNHRYPWKTKIENKDGFWAIPMNLTMISMGELLWVGYGAEVFNEIGTSVKEKSPAKFTIFSSLTNGCIGYLPTPEEHKLGGYEINLAPYFYRLPARLQGTAANLVCAKVESLIENIFNHSPGQKS